METITDIRKDAYLNKSFFVLGKSLNHCYDCKYCRANDGEQLSFQMLPGEIDPRLKNIPVAVNLFYGDPLIQRMHTLNLLNRLEENGHRGPVVVITKGDLSRFPTKSNGERWKLDLHIGVSTFGVDSPYDGGSMEQFLNNLYKAEILNYKFNIEFRPIIKGINDSPEVIENIMQLASKFNVPVGYCGLQVPKFLMTKIAEEGLPFEPYENLPFGLKKYISPEVEHTIWEMADKYGVKVFVKTSCLLASQHGYERDFNAHYYRPNEVHCDRCPMFKSCRKFKNKLDRRTQKIGMVLPWAEAKLVRKDTEPCLLCKTDICKIPSPDCEGLKGNVIKLPDGLTRADIRMVKWLTGYMAESKITEEPYLSGAWFDGNWRKR